MILKISPLMACLLLTAGCAKIADPLPPLVRIPKPAEDLAAAQTADSIVLKFSAPTLNTDGSPATTLHRIRVMRLDEDANERMAKQTLPEGSFLQRAEPILTIESPDFPGYLQNGIFVVRDQSAIPQKSKFNLAAFRYAVLFINKKNQAAG